MSSKDLPAIRAIATQYIQPVLTCRHIGDVNCAKAKKWITACWQTTSEHSFRQNQFNKEEDQMKISSCATIILMALHLAACGGSESESSSAPEVTVSVQPVFGLPSFGRNGITLPGADIEIAASVGDYLLTFGGRINLVLSGSGNDVFFIENVKGGVFTISGNDNTLVFREGDAVSSLTVTGTGNTIYIPLNSSIAVTGGATAVTTVRRYDF